MGRPSTKEYISINQWITNQLEEAGKTKYWLSKQIGCHTSHADNLLKKTDPSSALFANIIQAIAIAKDKTDLQVMLDWYRSCHRR